MTTIYLVRHGQASFGKSNYDELSQNGEAQATLLGHYFKDILKEQPYVVAGTMQRHLQTAQGALKESFPEAMVHTNAGWNEFNHQQVFAHYEPRFKQPELLKADVAKEANPRAYLAKIFEGAITRWTEGEFHHEYEESWPDFKQRVETALQDLCNELAQSKPRYAVVFTSGGVISVAAGKILELNPNRTFALNWAIANTSLTTLRLVGNEPQLLSLNEHHFIKAENPDLLTWI
ncbi:histidine phosphatase family protein [Acinetobacter guerrae]|uniref:histidine phosphatase family protein n=1 Tax=Acinetobacter guerrae TaxID=1843371 RepID=UPI00125F239F|nr:histidine phosphatase family protein [Acinetobacter guerrae]